MSWDISLCVCNPRRAKGDGSDEVFMEYFQREGPWKSSSSKPAEKDSSTSAVTWQGFKANRWFKLCFKA